MTIRDGLISAFYTIGLYKVRSLLTILGVVIGVAAITIISSLGKGSRLAILSEMERIGADLLWVGVEEKREGFGGFNNEDIEAIKRVSTSVKAISLETSISGIPFKHNRQRARFTVVGVDPSYQQILRILLIKGRFISYPSQKEGMKVCVLEDSDATRRIFGFSNPVGKRVDIYNETFRIIGVVEPKRALGTIVEGRVYIPSSTFFRCVAPIPSHLLYVQVSSLLKIKEASLEIKRILEFRHQKERVSFQVLSLVETLKSTQRLVKIATLVLGGVAFISLLVSGIGIANIMLISVIERTSEIGLRKAIGARKGDILFQFLTEAVVLSASGGSLGAMCGIILSWFIAPFFNIPSAISFFGVGIALFCSVSVGLISGIYPAYQASNLTPIEALRHK